jgi:AcrR family transcriptional regulator
MSQVRSGKPYHHGELREALVAAGRKLLEERGLRGFTLRECARRAEVSHAAPAHHFASIGDLLAEIASRGYGELCEVMTTEAARGGGDPAARLVGLGVGYMAFAAAHPALFQLMFSREAIGVDSPALAEAARAAYQLQRDAVAAMIPAASPEIQQRMVDFARSTMHGFITLVLETQLGERESPQGLKARGLAILSTTVETILRAGAPS